MWSMLDPNSSQPEKQASATYPSYSAAETRPNSVAWRSNSPR